MPCRSESRTAVCCGQASPPAPRAGEAARQGKSFIDEARAAITERLWSEFHLHLRRFVVSRLHDEHAADDVLQDVFLKVHKSIGSLRDEAKIGAWIYTIARNAISDHYRQRAMESLDPELDIETERGIRSAEQDLAVSLGLRVNRLPERYR